MSSAFGVVHKGPINDPTGLVQTVRRAAKLPPVLKKGKLKAMPIRNKYKRAGF